jgi:3-oxoadipate enol-lactonase
LSNSPKDAWRKRVEAVRAEGVAPQVEPAIERWFTPAYRGTQIETMRAARAMILRTSRDGYAGCSAATRDMALADAIRDISVQTLVIAGEQDHSTPLSILEAIAAKIPGATLVRAPNAAHMPTIEQADLCNRAILEFLGTVEAERSLGSPSLR